VEPPGGDPVDAEGRINVSARSLVVLQRVPA
jgi:hypothetical protein